MSLIQNYRCDVCGYVKRRSNDWFTIRTVQNPRTFVATPFRPEFDDDPEAMHCCGPSCLMKAAGRWSSGAGIAGAHGRPDEAA